MSKDGETMKTKRIMFSRPVQIGDIDYEVDVPYELEHEDEIQEWIMNNLDKVEQASFSVDSYYLNNQIHLAADPSNWESWSVEIDPALNYIEYEDVELYEDSDEV